MSRLLTLLIIFALTVTNAAIVTAAICEHESAFAHAAARQSAEAAVSSQAQSEDAVASSASKKGSLSQAAASVAGHILPAEPEQVGLVVAESPIGAAFEPSILASRSVRPLLEPPLA